MQWPTSYTSQRVRCKSVDGIVSGSNTVFTPIDRETAHEAVRAVAATKRERLYFVYGGDLVPELFGKARGEAG